MELNPWLNTQLIDDIYLKSMESHLLMIDYEEKIMQNKIFVINNNGSSGHVS